MVIMSNYIKKSKVRIMIIICNKENLTACIKSWKLKRNNFSWKPLDKKEKNKFWVKVNQYL